MLYYCQAEVEVYVTMWSPLTTLVGGAHFWRVGQNVSASYLVFSDTTLVGMLADQSVRLCSRFPTWLLLLWVSVGPQFFQWCLTRIEWLLSKSVIYKVKRQSRKVTTVFFGSCFGSLVCLSLLSILQLYVYFFFIISRICSWT